MVARKFVSVEEYLAGEPASEIRHEYIGGEVHAMAGGSRSHNLISGNLYLALRQHVGAGPCRVFMSDVKVRLEIARDDVFYYPDVLVACDPEDNHRYYVTGRK